MDQSQLLMVDRLLSRGQLIALHTQKEKEATICLRLKATVGFLKANQLYRLSKTCNSAPKMDSSGTMASLVIGVELLLCLLYVIFN